MPAIYDTLHNQSAALGTRLFTVTTQDLPEGHALITAPRTALAAEMAKG